MTKWILPAVMALLISHLPWLQPQAQAEPESESKSLTLITNTWPPYVDSTLPGQGLAVELVSEVLERAGYKTTVTIETWPRAMEGTKLGIYDGIVAAWYTEQRDKDFYYSDAYLVNKLRVMKLKRLGGDYFEMAHLEGKRLGIITGYAYGIDFSTIDNIQLVEESYVIQSVLNLVNGKVDFIVVDERTVSAEINKYLSTQKDQFEFLDIEIPVRSLYFVTSKSNPGNTEIIKRFNAALKAMKNAGVYSELVNRWDDKLSIVSQ